MLMTVMVVGQMRVTMPELAVHVQVRVRLARWLAAIMTVLVVLVMYVSMFVSHLVAMFVLVALRQMKPHSDGHEKGQKSSRVRYSPARAGATADSCHANQSAQAGWLL